MNRRVSNNTQDIIKKLGYKNSSNLYFFTNINECKDLSFHDRKVLHTIEPCAFFVVDGKPKVLFFDYIEEKRAKQELYKKIWNAQVPIIIFCDFDSIKIFNGNSMDLTNLDNLSLNIVAEEEYENCNENSVFSYWNVTSEKFLREYEKQFTKDTLNEVMIRNIKCITDKLKNHHHVEFATKLILRIIFIRFLVDRGVNIGYDGFDGNIIESQKSLLDISKNKSKLYALFTYLKEKFNGNLFELGHEIDNQSLTDDVFILLECFLSGTEEMDTGQLSFLQLYDFNIIPIELISNIYEILLGKEGQENDKAFYTPEYLADYIVKETVGTFLATNNQCKVLDPSCGSGIFLVQTLKQIIKKNVDKDGYIKDNALLIAIIENNIYGVDLNPEAIDITIFSLYLTLFDYKDPKSLEGFKLPNLKNKNLWVSDFFDDNNLSKLQEIDFQFILGNPPWGAIKSGLHLQYCGANNINQQRQEISRSFIAKTEEYSSENTICSLVIPSKLFYNQQIPAVEFRKRMLLKSKIIKFVELSSVRKLLFKTADAPAAILMFQYSKEKCLNHNMIHISLKPNMFFKLYHVIATEKNDIKKIQQRVLYENDWAWKACVYGNNWDIDNIRMLKRKYITLSDEFVKEGLKTASGISDNKGDFDASCYKGRKIIESTAIDSFYFDTSQCSMFTKDRIYRIGKEKVYQPPYCLMRKGPNCKTYRLRAAYVDDNVIFKEAVSAIKGNESQKDLLLNIVGLLNSSLYAYLNLMLGSSMGIEREQVFMNEIYQYPFIEDEEISKIVSKIQEKKANLDGAFFSDTSEEEEKLDNLILKKFGLDNDPFIDYALKIHVNMLNSKKWDYNEVTIADLEKYAQVFLDYWKSVMENQNKYIKINLYPRVINKFTIFELFIVENKPENEITVSTVVDNNKEFLSRFTVNKVNEQFYQISDVIHFDNDSFYIIKSTEAKNWHTAMAYIDNTAVVDTILSDGKGE